MPLWFPGLGAELAGAAWCRIEKDLGLTRDSYGTARVLRRDPEAERDVIACLEPPGEESCDAIPVEILPADSAFACAGPEVRFFSAEDALGGVAGRVQEAIGILATVPTLLPTVCTLVRALHLIDPGDDEIDVSFSEPGLPFSAFISVPGPSAPAGPLRVAEALLHEAMHLQLTLIEEVVPLVGPSERAYFSPWRNEYRTAQGVLHALYVFRVIEGFLGAANDGSGLAPWRSHASERRATIAHQVQEIHDFHTCTDLTEEGAAFVIRLLGECLPLTTAGGARRSRSPSS